MEKKNKNDYPGDDSNRNLPFESPQTEESERLSKIKSADAVETKNNPAKGEGNTRGGNQSINQGKSAGN
jgi:hypothetical protein